jgi:hypothetical protein
MAWLPRSLLVVVVVVGLNEKLLRRKKVESKDKCPKDIKLGGGGRWGIGGVN